MFRASFAVVAALIVLAAPRFADAATEHVHGVILGVTPGDGQIVVRHDPFGGMPSMTMPFRVAPAAQVRQLQPGETIDAVVDTHTDPWTLRNLTVASEAAVTDDHRRPVVPLQVGELVPDTPFVDQTGRPFRFSQLRGQSVILSFIYTRCQDPAMCPLISAKFNTLQRALGARRLHLVEVTLDPTYDRPPVLARYARTFGADPKHWTLAVGDADPTLDFAARFGIFAVPEPGFGIVHSENTIEIDPQGRIENMIAENTWQPADLLADIDAQQRAASDPLFRLNRTIADAAVATFGNSVAPLSGFTDLLVLLAIVAACGYLFFRLARGIFAKHA